MTRQEFIDLLMPHALEASRRTGVDPRIIIAQAAQETGWGRSAPGNNFFGIKSHGQGGGNTFSTTEYVNGQPVRINDSFRSYESPAASVAGYADFLLANPRYRAMMQAQGIDAQLQALGASGYATDPNYAASVGSIARGITVPGGAQPMAYTAPAATPAAQGAISAATGPAAGLPAPAPAPGSQRLFRPRSEAIAAREAGGTPRLDELSNIIQQRRAGMNPLLERLQNFIQTRRAARQEDQAPTPPAPIPANSARPSGGGGSNADPAVMQLQQELAAAGFDPGPIDGLMGPRTRAAMAARDAAAASSAPIPPPNPMRGPPPLPNPNVARPGVAPAGPAAQANLNYRIPVTPSAPAAITAPRPSSLTTGSLTPMTQPPPAARANLDYGIPIQPRTPAAVPTPSANPTLGPMLAGYNTPGNGVGVPTMPVSRGVLPDAAPPAFPRATAPTLRPPQGALPPMQTPPPWGTEPMPPATLQRAAWSPDPSVFDPARVVASMPQASLSAPGWGGEMPPPAPSPTTLVANTGTPFPREDAVNRGFMPAGRDDFGLQNGFFRDLPGFNDQNPNIMAPQALSGAARPVTTTTPSMPNMPLRGMTIPPWWRMFMGAGV